MNEPHGIYETQAMLYGKGVFTTIAFQATGLFLWEKHWRRLKQNSKKLDIDISEITEESIIIKLDTAIHNSGLAEGRARLSLFDESRSDLWSDDDERSTSIQIVVARRHSISSFFKLTTSLHFINTTSPLTGLKSCNYLEKIITLGEAKSSGFDEAVLINEHGEVASAVMANVFWFADGELFTPSLKTGCLAGTTREIILEKIDCREVEVSIDALGEARAIFLTSAGIGVVQVAEFEAKRFEKIDHPILHLLPY